MGVSVVWALWYAVDRLRVRRRPKTAKVTDYSALLQAMKVDEAAKRREEDQALVKTAEEAIRLAYKDGTHMGLRMGLHAAQQLARRDAKASGDLDDSGDSKVS
jgi:hypothetical protein